VTGRRSTHGKSSTNTSAAASPAGARGHCAAPAPRSPHPRQPTWRSPPGPTAAERHPAAAPARRPDRPAQRHPWGALHLAPLHLGTGVELVPQAASCRAGIALLTDAPRALIAALCRPPAGTDHPNEAPSRPRRGVHVRRGWQLRTSAK
jgi:hypothetical protein